jgi:flavin reductase (DIM6/NTAB) family NADH-FMN oxidoreductase RutF
VTVALDQAAYRAAIGHFASGVAVVTTRSSAGPSGLTANAVCSLSLDPLLLLACLDRGSRTLEAVRGTGRLAVNVLARDQEDLAVHFARKMPDGEKFGGVPFRDVGGLPVLEGVVAWLGGTVQELLPGGDHEIAVVAVEAAEAAGGAPLIFHRGGYRSLGSD